MSVQNRALVLRYFAECLNAAGGPEHERALAVLDELLSAEFVMLYNNQSDDEAAHGRERHKAFVARHARTFVDDDWTIEALVADDDIVACRWRIEATHGETGNPIDVRAADFYTVRDGQLVRLHRFLDFEGFEQQFKN